MPTAPRSAGGLLRAGGARGAGGLRASDAEQVDREEERRVGRDRGLLLVSVAERRRDDQRATTADSHAGDALPPAGDHAAVVDADLERLATRVPGGVESSAG